MMLVNGQRMAGELTRELLRTWLPVTDPMRVHKNQPALEYHR